MLAMGLLASCEKETKTLNNLENQSKVLSEETAMAMENKETRNTAWLIEKSRYQLEAKDYKVFIYAEDEQSMLNQETSPTGKNQIFTGEYSIYLAEKDSPVAYKEIELGESIFNLTVNQVYMIQLDNTSIVAVLQSIGHGQSKPALFVLQDGELKSINLQLSSILGTDIKVINQKYLQTVEMKQNKEWIFTTWEYDQEGKKLHPIDESILAGDDEGRGEYWYQLWTEKQEFYFPFQNLELTSDFVEKAKLGIPLGSPFPIGTNIANIKKSEPYFMEEGFMDGSPYLMYPEISYFYEQSTGIVSAVSIPGERVKTNLNEIKRLFGVPERESNNPNGEGLVVYNADKYAVEIAFHANGEVQNIYLRKK